MKTLIGSKTKNMASFSNITEMARSNMTSVSNKVGSTESV